MNYKVCKHFLFVYTTDFQYNNECLCWIICLCTTKKTGNGSFKKILYEELELLLIILLTKCFFYLKNCFCFLYIFTYLGNIG